MDIKWHYAGGIKVYLRRLFFSHVFFAISLSISFPSAFFQLANHLVQWGNLLHSRSNNSSAKSKINIRGKRWIEKKSYIFYYTANLAWSKIAAMSDIFVMG
jgi:hypothetical protein